MSEGQPSPLERFIQVRSGEKKLEDYGEYAVLQQRVDNGVNSDRSEMQVHAEAAQKYGANAVVAGTIERAVKKLGEIDRTDPDKVADAIIAEVPNIGKKIEDRAKLYGPDAQIAMGYGEVLLLKEAMLAHTLLVVSEHRKVGEEIPQPLKDNLAFVLGSMVNEGGKGEPVIDWNKVVGTSVLEDLDFKELATVVVVGAGVAKVGFDLLKQAMTKDATPEISAEPELTVDQVKGLAFEETHSLIMAGTDRGRRLDPAIEAALFTRRKDLVDAAKRGGLLDLYPARITDALRDANCTWKTFDRILADRAEAYERESQGVSGYRPEFKGLVREAVEGLIPLAELQGWEKADATQRAKRSIDSSLLARLRERVKREVIWDLGKNLAAYIDEGPTAAPVPATGGMGVELLRVNPDDVERLLLDRLQEGGMKKTQEGDVIFSDLSTVTEAVTKLEGAEDPATRERAKLFRSMANLLTDIGSGERNKPGTHTRISVDREAMVLLEKQGGMMGAWKTVIELAGFNFGVASAEQIRNGEIPTGFVSRTTDLESLVARTSPSLARDSRLQNLFNEYDEFGALKEKRTFWDLKAGDMGDADGRWGYVHLLRVMMSNKMEKGETSTEVQRAVAIGIGLLRHSRLVEQFAIDPDHPWVDAEVYRLMHPADMFRRRAMANHDAVKDAFLAPYVKANKDDFAVRPTGEYGRGAGVPETTYDWNELFFPPDWFGSWLFAKDVMNKEGVNDMTPWDYVGRGVAPTADKFRPKNIWELENFRRQAAVVLDSMVFEKVEPIDTGKKEAWADKIATDAADILKKMGVINKFTNVSDLSGKQDMINRVVRVVAMSRMGGMSMDKGKLNMPEDKAAVIRYGLDGLKFTFKFMMDDESEKELPVNMEDASFAQWIENSGAPLPRDKAAGAERTILKWLREDNLVHEVIRILAQGLKDQASRDKVRQINFRKKVGIGPNPTWYGGLGTHSAKAWLEREAMANFDKNGLTRVLKKINELNFG